MLPYIGLVLACSGTVSAEVIERQYDGYKVWIDCDLRGSIKYEYKMTQDNANFPRAKNFYFAPDVPKRCQQTSTKTYKNKNGKSTFDRGHMTPANSQDFSKKAIKQSNFMINVWPQHRDLNRGAMLHTETIAECFRDIEPVQVYGGILKGAPANKNFLVSHGIVTPGYFWKVITRKDRAIAWILPNKKGVGKKQLDKYLVSIRDLEKLTGETFPIADYLKDEKPQHSWYIPKGCDRS